MKQKLVIGTRGSRLALVQADMVKTGLLQSIEDLEVETRIYKTKGDKILDSPLSAIGDKGLFIRELEDALLSGEIDLAVHSMKDMPTELPGGLIIGAVLPRGESRDAFVSRDGRKLDEFGQNDVIATSSLRRKAQILSLGRGISIIDIRGNVDTRLGKLDSGYCSGLVLAGAGLLRSGFEHRITELLDDSRFPPAVCQGIICLETRAGDNHTLGLLQNINDPQTLLSAGAERAFLHFLEGGCQVPIGCRTRLENGFFIMDGAIWNLEGTRSIRKTISVKAETAGEAEAAAEKLASEILAEGGGEILHGIR